MTGGDVRTGHPLLREMRVADLLTVTEIERASYTTPWSAATFEGLLGRPDADLLVADSEGRVVGYAVAWSVLDRAELGNVAVDADRRRRGIASRLLTAIIERVSRRGVRELFLEVRVSNTGAQELYRRFGFIEVSRRRNYYTDPVEDAVVMVKHLDRRDATSG